MYEHSNEVLGDDPAPLESLRSNAVTVTPPIRLAAVVLICSAALLAASGLLTWFVTSNPGFKNHKFAGFRAARSSSWYLSVPVGWPLLFVAMFLCAVAVLILRTERAQWIRAAATGCVLLSTLAILLVLKNKSYVPYEIPLKLRESLLPLIKSNPASKDQIEKEFASLAVNVRSGLWVALVGAISCTTISVFIVLKSRRPSESPSA